MPADFSWNAEAAAQLMGGSRAGVLRRFEEVSRCRDEPADLNDVRVDGFESKASRCRDERELQ